MSVKMHNGSLILTTACHLCKALPFLPDPCVKLNPRVRVRIHQADLTLRYRYDGVAWDYEYGKRSTVQVEPESGHYETDYRFLPHAVRLRDYRYRLVVVISNLKF